MSPLRSASIAIASESTVMCGVERCAAVAAEELVVVVEVAVVDDQPLARSAPDGRCR